MLCGRWPITLPPEAEKLTFCAVGVTWFHNVHLHGLLSIPFFMFHTLLTNRSWFSPVTHNKKAWIQTWLVVKASLVDVQNTLPGLYIHTGQTHLDQLWLWGSKSTCSWILVLPPQSPPFSECDFLRNKSYSFHSFTKYVISTFSGSGHCFSPLFEEYSRREVTAAIP